MLPERITPRQTEALLQNRRTLGRSAAVLLLMLTAFALSGCGKQEISEAYRFPEDGLVSLLEATEDIRAEGFAADLCIPDTEGEKNAEGVSALSFGLFDLQNGEVLSQKDPFEKVYPASTTKILTCLIALERGNLDDMVTVPKESAITVSGSSMADLKPGDRLTLRELLYGLMVPSGNDAAVAIAHHISGDIDGFAAVMNQRARELGATHSHFVNPHGLPDQEHYVTVYDMYLIFREALKNPTFREIARTAEYTCTVENDEDAGGSREVTWTSGNGFYNGRYAFADGMEILCGKTGHTNAAGFCLVLGEEDSAGGEYISIIMNAPEYEKLYQSMRTLVEKAS